MSWNNGYERKKFEQAQKAQAKEYPVLREIQWIPFNTHDC